MNKTSIVLVASILLISCQPKKSDYFSANNPFKKFKSVKELKTTLEDISNLKNSVFRDSIFNILWDSLLINNQIPFTSNEFVLFMYRGKADNIHWTGDFTDWKLNKHFKGSRIGNLDLWFLEKQFPTDACLEYKILKNKTDGIVDEANKYIQHILPSESGVNSVLRMPEWNYPSSTVENPETPKGQISETKKVSAKSLDIEYCVYTPHNYGNTDNLPSLYVFDGQHYMHSSLGALSIQLDNLIDKKIVEPLIVVFIDNSCRYDSAHNEEDKDNPNLIFVDFFVNNLIPAIDLEYKTFQDSSKRGIMGIGESAAMALYLGITHHATINLIAAQSPILNDEIMKLFGHANKLPLKIFLSCGTFFDNDETARLFRDVIIYKGFSLIYHEINQGHSWGNWRGQIDKILEFFYPVNKQEKTSND